MHGYTCALSARLPVFLGTKVPERNLQILLHVYILTIYTPFTTHAPTYVRANTKRL